MRPRFRTSDFTAFCPANGWKDPFFGSYTARFLPSLAQRASNALTESLVTKTARPPSAPLSSDAHRLRTRFSGCVKTQEPAVGFHAAREPSVATVWREPAGGARGGRVFQGGRAHVPVSEDGRPKAAFYAFEGVIATPLSSSTSRSGGTRPGEHGHPRSSKHRPCPLTSRRRRAGRWL